MLDSTRIPLRPDDYVSNLSQAEQSCLTWYTISGCPKKEAFIMFVRPDMYGSRAKASITEYVKQFFAQKDCVEYLDHYQKTLERFLNPSKKKSEGSMEERKAKAKTKLVEFAMSLASSIDRADDPEFVLKIADKAGLLDQEEEYVEQPRRYLPVSCHECAYRQFVEENCESGTEIANG